MRQVALQGAQITYLVVALAVTLASAGCGASAKRDGAGSTSTAASAAITQQTSTAPSKAGRFVKTPVVLSPRRAHGGRLYVYVRLSRAVRRGPEVAVNGQIWNESSTRRVSTKPACYESVLYPSPKSAQRPFDASAKTREITVQLVERDGTPDGRVADERTIRYRIVKDGEGRAGGSALRRMGCKPKRVVFP